MKITFLGNFRIDYCSEYQYAKELEALGHTVWRLQESKATADEVLANAKHSDLFVWVHTHGWKTEGSLTMEQVLSQLRLLGVPSVAYHLDLYMGISRWQEYEQSEYLNKIDYFFTVDKLMADFINSKKGITKSYYLPAGVFSQEVNLKQKEMLHDIVFTGSRHYHPEWSYRPELVDWLESTYGSRFEHYGNDGIKIMRGEALNNLYQTTRVVIGDTLCPHYNYPYYWSDRVYEVTGRGGFIIHPYIKGLDAQFRAPQEIVTYTYRDFTELKSKIDFYLANDLCRERVRRAGYDRTRKDHTYKNRWQYIIETVCKN